MHSSIQAGVEEERRPQRAAELTAVISGLGPAVIKAGQARSPRRRSPDPNPDPSPDPSPTPNPNPNPSLHHG